MKRDARSLLDKALDSLVLAIEHFNRPYERGRSSTTLLLLHHAFEMLLKASIVHRGGRIKTTGARETHGYKTCLGIATSSAEIRFLTEADAMALRSIYALRNGAQHHVMYVSEQQLYLQCQAGLTLFRDVLRTVFQEDLASRVPARVLPISVTPPVDMITLFDEQLNEIRHLLAPGKRRRTEAMGRLRPLAILDRAVSGEVEQPTDTELSRQGAQVASGWNWRDVFPGAATIAFVEHEGGASFGLRFTKKDGLPIHFVQPDEAEGLPVGVKRVSELDFYNLGLNDLGQKVGLNSHRTLALIWHLNLKQSDEYYKEIVIGKSVHKRYSQKAILRIRKAIESEDVEQISRAYGRRRSP